MNIRNYISEKYQLYINGQWTNGTEEQTIDSLNPATGEKMTTIIDATDSDVDQAVLAAQEAFKTWKNTSLLQRSNLLLKIANAIEAHSEHLAYVETLDNGKPIRESTLGDLPMVVDHFRYFAGVIRSEEGAAQTLDKNTLSIVLREPLGVVGQIIPWNFPLLMAAWKLAPALAMGNTVVIHPSSSTSTSILELTKIIGDLLPRGVLNVITGKGAKSGEYMLHHPGIQKLAFTGSTEVGYNVAKAAADRLIPSTLELGGKSANIVFNDAPWEKALAGIQMGILFNQGQVCSAGSRIFVQEEIYDRFVSELKTAFEKIKVGLPWEKETQMGAQINEVQVNRILNYIEIGKNEGATVLTGGHRLTKDGLHKGAFIAPTLLTDVQNSMRVAQEEIFGPVAVIIKFKTIDEVIALANESDYGLAGAVWTQDLTTAFRVGKEVQTGRIWVNTYNQIPSGAPFGGYKLSGLGRETYKTALDAYSNTKSIFIDLSPNKIGFY